MLLNEGMNKVTPNRIGTLGKVKSPVSHKSTPELWTHINTGGNIMFLLSEAVDRVASKLMAFRELKSKISRDND